jgi:hypothetical protein
MKRICGEHPDWIVPYLDRLLDEISQIDQPSTQWTLAQLFLWLHEDMSDAQRHKATALLQRNLEAQHDWIVKNHTMETLAAWAAQDDALRAWLLPRLRELTADPRKSVAGRARKKLAQLEG